MAGGQVVYILFFEFRPEALILLLMFRPEANVLVLVVLDAGHRPGCMMLRIHHAEISLESEAYGDGFSCLLPVASWSRRDVTVEVYGTHLNIFLAAYIQCGIRDT